MAEAVLSGGVSVSVFGYVAGVCLSVCLSVFELLVGVHVGINLLAYTNVCTHALSPTNMRKLLPLTLTHTHISI